jgi:hypothetical protein
MDYYAQGRMLSRDITPMSAFKSHRARREYITSNPINLVAFRTKFSFDAGAIRAHAFLFFAIALYWSPPYILVVQRIYTSNHDYVLPNQF